ncbi:MAG: hypothetical protein B7Z80_22860 [Rhodospirillales bacterium 20-64-7]|nr:MAG: hypothetical protein B7Z80_22860 [Rhodospirillales bacterium 20-64-7]
MADYAGQSVGEFDLAGGKSLDLRTEPEIEQAAQAYVSPDETLRRHRRPFESCEILLQDHDRKIRAAPGTKIEIGAWTTRTEIEHTPLHQDHAPLVRQERSAISGSNNGIIWISPKAKLCSARCRLGGAQDRQALPLAAVRIHPGEPRIQKRAGNVQGTCAGGCARHPGLRAHRQQHPAVGRARRFERDLPADEPAPEPAGRQLWPIGPLRTGRGGEHAREAQTPAVGEHNVEKPVDRTDAGPHARPDSTGRRRLRKPARRAGEEQGEHEEPRHCAAGTPRESGWCL